MEIRGWKIVKPNLPKEYVESELERLRNQPVERFEIPMKEEGERYDRNESIRCVDTGRFDD